MSFAISVATHVRSERDQWLETPAVARASEVQFQVSGRKTKEANPSYSRKPSLGTGETEVVEAEEGRGGGGRRLRRGRRGRQRRRRVKPVVARSPWPIRSTHRAFKGTVGSLLGL